MTRLQRLRAAFVLAFRSRLSRVERLRREMRESAWHQGNLNTRHDALLAARTVQCRYHPDNGGTGREPGDARHFSDYVENVLGDQWGDDEAASWFVAARQVAVREEA